jgi:hypothetical protein
MLFRYKIYIEKIIAKTEKLRNEGGWMKYRKTIQIEV